MWETVERSDIETIYRKRIFNGWVVKIIPSHGKDNAIAVFVNDPDRRWYVPITN